jgi:hypothetical protein
MRIGMTTYLKRSLPGSNQRAGIGVVEAPLNFFSVDVVQHVKQITNVEADVDDVTGVIDFDFFLLLPARRWRRSVSDCSRQYNTHATEFLVGQDCSALHGLHQRLATNRHVVFRVAGTTRS